MRRLEAEGLPWFWRKRSSQKNQKNRDPFKIDKCHALNSPYKEVEAYDPATGLHGPLTMDHGTSRWLTGSKNRPRRPKTAYQEVEAYDLATGSDGPLVMVLGSNRWLTGPKKQIPKP